MTPDLFSWQPPVRPTYPDAAGFKAYGTSKQAADAITPILGQLQGEVLRWLRTRGEEGGTPDECAKALNLSILTARPRFSELKEKGLITPIIGKHGMTESGKKSQFYIARGLA